MQLNIFSHNNHSVSQWAGGTTKELWIWPENANYASRNFCARISSATVRLLHSDFTILPNVVRFITPLSGSFTLSHPDGTSITLSPLDPPYRFDGGVATHCVGKATDFNLMLKGVEGDMIILSGQLSLSSGICCVFAPLNLAVNINGNTTNLVQGDLAVIRPESGEKITIEAVKAIVCRILI